MSAKNSSSIIGAVVGVLMFVILAVVITVVILLAVLLVRKRKHGKAVITKNESVYSTNPMSK